MKQLHKGHLGNGISLWEDGDNEYKGHISPERKIRDLELFAPENQVKIKDLAEKGNMIVGNDNDCLALNPLNKPTETSTNSVTKEVYKISIETIGGIDYRCCGSQIFGEVVKK